ncbi:MAG: hydrogenase expression/formation protein HypE [bacterium]|nr:hydrogenase expression/formation protein HypE [bacterium]
MHARAPAGGPDGLLRGGVRRIPPLPGASVSFEGPACPLPINDYPTVTLGHGGGGRLMHALIRDLFVAAFDNETLRRMGDGALLDLDAGTLAFSTDGFVIDPIEFPGGNIGSLAVHGTVNDVAMCGARPVALSAGFILEEGLPMETLWRVACAMGDAAREAAVPIVTGDTKVVGHGKGDGVFIHTSGVGVRLPGADIAPERARPGDFVLLNGPIADHGIAILSVREGLEFETAIESDSACLAGLVEGMIEAGGEGVRVLRDPTRGGVASTLNEIAEQAGVGIELDERAIPLREEVRGACEILGLDPLYVANEGKCLAIVDAAVADSVVRVMRSHPLGRESVVVGRVVEDAQSTVLLRSSIGGTRIVDVASGEQLPRIC